MIVDRIAHLDLSDYYCGLNVVTGWGSYTSTKLILWQLGLVMEIKLEDAVFFMGRIIMHNMMEIEGGIRNVLDIFAYQNSLIWKNRKHKKLTGYGRKGKPGKERKNKGKQKQVKDDDAVELEKPEELDTDEKIEVMYMEAEETD
ncbi:hypothetical protein FGG08_005969 [Glutinoglossum americanum]|uniref:Uncharacterized protein n=1 Tax=Glutinoglossum americanum TaxID=1670608 RepID=A0A9P8HZA8_9PEZI|nr:hypothetical protein FGG08_005969 [Glutinoglossum americanum]